MRFSLPATGRPTGSYNYDRQVNSSTRGLFFIDIAMSGMHVVVTYDHSVGGGGARRIFSRGVHFFHQKCTKKLTTFFSRRPQNTGLDCISAKAQNTLQHFQGGSAPHPCPHACGHP